uniref:Secreted protein n=1 Tax=Angiostrongylus cantonensis TaxID=6313 RepID=A0A0K0D0W6_ANGCA
MAPCSTRSWHVQLYVTFCCVEYVLKMTHSITLVDEIWASSVHRNSSRVRVTGQAYINANAIQHGHVNITPNISR